MADAWTPRNTHIEIMSQEAQYLPEMVQTLPIQNPP
jgi:hypothetical protein